MILSLTTSVKSSRHFQFSSAFLAVLILVSASPLAAAGNQARANPFFAFDNGVGRAENWSPEKQAETLARLGYAGIGYTGVADLAARQAAFRAKGLKIFNLYVAVFVDRPVAYDLELTAALPQLAGTGTVLWLTVQGRSPNDDRAVALVRELADAAAAHGVRIALYPHKGFFIATAEDALRVLPRIDRSNVGLTINLCHELAAGHADRMDAIVQACAKHLMLVSINGADRSGGWTELIRPLGEGNFDVAGFLTSLDRIGYTGPIGLQCYNLKSQPEEHLAKSFAVWRSYRGQPH
jgi:sugar phosphate isomerase/epimerase